MQEDRDFDSSNIWRRSRYDVGVSQEFLANYIGVSRKTIRNWEAGVSAPDFNQGSKWFEGLGVNPLPYFLGYIYPDSVDGVVAKSSDEDVERALNDIIMDLPIEGKRQLLYLFYGNHGSSPRAVLDLLTAHLHLPMRDRILQAQVIISNYEMAESLGELVCNANIKPDCETINSAIKAAKDAVCEGHDGYKL